MAVGDEDCRRTMEAMLHVTKTNGVLHRSDPRFCYIAVGPECGTGVDRISERTLCVGRRRASCRFSRWSGSHALAPICVRRVCVRDAWHLSTDAKRSVGGHGELFDEFGSVIDGWERSDLGCDLTGAVSVLPVLEKPAQRSSDLVGGSLVLADGESCAELHQLGCIEPVVWWRERQAQYGKSSLERSRQRAVAAMSDDHVGMIEDESLGEERNLSLIHI